MADKSKDTGTGGINIDGKVHSMDVGLTDQENQSLSTINNGNWSSGDISVDKTIKDISKPTRETFAKYLSKTTLGQAGSSPHANKFPVGSGGNTTIQASSLKTTTGLPVPPGPQPNDSKFNAAFDSTIAAGSPLAIKKGLSDVQGQDGNELLPNAAVPANSGGEYVKNAISLKEPLNSYTKNILKPNLHSPLDENPVLVNVIVGDGGNVFPANVRDISVPTSFPVDAGTSKNILQPTANNVLTLPELAAKANSVTEGESTPGGLPNQYPVSAPLDPHRTYSFTQNGYPAGPSEPNENYFGQSVPYQSTYTDSLKEAQNVASNKFEIKRGKAPGTAPNGNELLTGATELAPPGGDYIKKAGPMNSAMQTYVSKVVDQNLKAPDPTVIVGPALIQLGEDGLPPTDEGAWPLHITTTLAEDGGTSKNVLTMTNPSHLLTLNEASAKAGEETNSAPVTEVANAYPVDATLQKFSHTDPATQMPVGPEPISNSRYYTKNAPINDSVLETYTPAAQDLDIKRGKAVGDGPDGNSLLLTAHKKSNPKSQEKTLQEPIKSYTEGVLGENLYVAEDKAVQSFEPPAQPFYGQAALHVPGELNEYSIKTTSQDLGTFDKIIDDPSKRTLNKEKATLRSLSELYGRNNVPGNIANKYTPSGILEPVEDFNVVDSTTNLPVSPTNSQANNQNSLQFIEGNKVPTSYSNAAKESKLNEKVKRGKSPVEGPDGNELLPKATLPADSGGKYIKNAGGDGGPADGPVKDYVSAILKKNRFNNNKKFLPNPFDLDAVPDLLIDQKISDAGNETFMRNNSFAGPDSLKLGESPGNEDETPRDYTFRRLTRVGTILQLRATGEIQALADDQTDPRDNVTVLASLLPGLGQFGAGAPLSNEFLNVKNILRTLPDEGDSFPPDIPIYEGQLIDFNSTYEGVLNNVFDKFSGFTVVGMLATAALMVTVVVLAFTGLGFLFGKNSGSKIDGAGGAKKANDVGRHGLGSYYGASIGSSPDDILNAFLPVGGDSSILLRFFGIMPTRIEFMTAVNSGVLSFFGVDDDFNPLTTAQSPGFFVVMARSIVRSAVAIVLAFKDLVDLFATGNAVSAVEQIFEILYIIKKSRFVAALNIFAQIGDTFSATNAAFFSNQTIAGLDAGLKISFTDSLIDDYPQAAYSKSRLNGTDSNSTLKLSWATNRTPDVLVLNKNSYILSNDITLGSGRLMTDDPLEKTRFEFLDASTIDNSARISTAMRESLESKFDSEYVPFYFQDLRTNELLGFHAFLTNLTDDYSAAYESTDGFGRVDPIKTYKSTNRKISLGFVIAALDSNDFDSMWLKINKLTTLVYPQYTEGRRLSLDNGANSFIKPFTQLIGASPMVRLRVGNVIASNYSKFNLAGIFGLTAAGTKLNNKNLDKIDDIIQALNSVAPSKRYAVGYKFYINSGKFLSKNKGFFDLSEYPRLFTAEIVDNADVDNTSIVTVKFSYNDPLSEDLVKLKNQYIIKIINEGMTDITVDFESFASINDLVFITPDTFSKMQQDLKQEFAAVTDKNAKEYLSEVNGFMNDDLRSPNANSIAKSFRSAGGKGLAGFIESMNFDWLGQSTWDVDKNRKAPKMCKVTMSFSPIHDISPGLDSNGYNRAPIYPIGPYKSRAV